MSFKFNPNASSERTYVREEGKFDFTVDAAEFKYNTRAELFASITLRREDGAVTTARVSGRPEKSGQYTRLNQYIGSTSTKDEVKALLARGEFEITDEFLKEVVERSVGRRLVAEVKAEVSQKDGKTYHSAVFFRPHAKGPEGEPF